MSHQHVLKPHGSFSVRDPQMELITLIFMLFGAMAKLKMSLEIKAENKNSIFSKTKWGRSTLFSQSITLFNLLKRGHFLVLSKYDNAVSYRYGLMNELRHLDINRLMHELLGTWKFFGTLLFQPAMLTLMTLIVLKKHWTAAPAFKSVLPKIFLTFCDPGLRSPASEIKHWNWHAKRSHTENQLNERNK